MEIEREKYLVKFYSQISNSEESIMTRIFEDQNEANEFISKLGDRVIERLTLTKPKGYPDAELDLL